MSIRHKRKSSSGYAWTNTDLVDGQLGINTVDGSVHLLKTDATVQSILPGQPFHGVLSRTTIAPLPTNITTTTFTLSCATTPLTYYNNGIKRVVNTNQSTVLSGAAGLYFIYFNSAGTLVNGTTFPGLSAESGDVFIATVTWNGSNLGIINDERHGYARNSSWHTWAHNTVGARYGAGLTFTFAGTTNANTTFAVSAGNIYDEDINFTIAGATTARLWRQTAANVYSLVSASTTLPYLYSAGIQAVRSDTFALVTTNLSARYFNYFVYATTDVETPIQIVVETVAVGNVGGYTSAANARAASVPNLSAVQLSQEWKLLYRIVVNGAGLVQTIVAGDDYRSSSSLPSGGVASSTASSVTYTPTAPEANLTVQSALDARPLTALVPVGGTTGQVLSKVDAIDYNLTWSTVSGGGGTTLNSYKDPVRVATTANITLSGTQTIDGVAVVAGDRVLAKNQTTASGNGIWVVAAGAWTRPTDFNTSALAQVGSVVKVQFGTIQAGMEYQLLTGGANPIVLDTSTQTWGPCGGFAQATMSTSTPAIASGTNSLAWGAGTTAAAPDSIIIGRGASVTSAATDSIAIGRGAYNAGNPDSIAIGRATQGSPTGVAIGYSAITTTASGASVALGNRTYTVMAGQFNHGATNFAAASGEGGSSLLTYWTTTTTTTPVEIGSGSNTTATAPTGRIVLDNASTYMFNCDIVGRKSATGTDYAAFNVQFLISREANAGTTALVGTPKIDVIAKTSGAATWNVTVAADTTNGRPNISVTGQATTTIRWVANIRMTKVSG